MGDDPGRECLMSECVISGHRIRRGGPQLRARNGHLSNPGPGRARAPQRRKARSCQVLRGSIIPSGRHQALAARSLLVPAGDSRGAGQANYAETVSPLVTDSGLRVEEAGAPRSGPRGTGFVGEAPSGSAPIGKELPIEAVTRNNSLPMNVACMPGVPRQAAEACPCQRPGRREW